MIFFVSDNTYFLNNTAIASNLDFGVNFTVTFFAAQTGTNNVLPVWLAFNSNSPEFSGTPTREDIGDVNITLRVCVTGFRDTSFIRPVFNPFYCVFPTFLLKIQDNDSAALKQKILLIEIITPLAGTVLLLSICSIIFYRRLKKVNKIVSVVAFTEDERKDLFGGRLDVFISYQWDHQDIVKKIKNSLDTDFKVWMDVDKMVVGDNLYVAMEKGIRAAKIVIMCISKPYTLSTNCKKEADLTSALKKPIIPLLMSDDVSWPPEGLGTIVGGLLYKDFRNANSTTVFNQNMEDLKQTIKQKLSDTILYIAQ